MPRHIAIFMDGNGRWARRRGVPRMMAHRAGRESVREVVKGCVALGVEVLTLYTFFFARYLYTAGLPDPDLLIRTSGEMRLSNFMPWQVAYTELWIPPTLWPDFRRRHLFRAVAEFQKRERRFGRLD